MSLRALNAPLLEIVLSRGDDEPLQRQLYRQVRELVLTGRLLPGERLPSTRALAQELGCSRNTVLGAFDQLLSEGYLEGHTGSGTYISSVLPEDLGAVESKPRTPVVEKGVRTGAGLSKRGQSLASIERRTHAGHRTFSPGLPDLASFPFPVWSRYLARNWRHPKAELLTNPDPCGYAPLRKAIADYLRVARGIHCDWRQVMITSGSQQGIDFAARLLLDPGDTVWFEEPGYPGLRGPLLSAGVKLQSVPVDEEGLAVTQARRVEPKARMAVVSPSHQFPLGVVMSLRRRLELLDWAEEQDAWILEDDYDSEFRFSGRPIASLLGLEAERQQQGQQQAAQAGRVIYLGSFSKVMFHALRLGYLVVPEDLVEAAAQARMILDDRTSLVAQPALADFIAEGHFAAHIRRMRRLYGERQEILYDNITEKLGRFLTVAPDEAGMHLTTFFTEETAARTDDRTVVRLSDAAGVSVSPLSLYYADPAQTCQGLLLGYGACQPEEIASGCEKLARVFEQAIDR